jgi:NAD(P)-dependent dehydrogenase (short-subunit alcohol dehydrogenase family)
MSNKIWFITGVSSGIGRHLAEQAALAGNTVIGTVRKQSQVEDINNLVSGKTFGYVLNVNDHPKVTDVINEVASKFGKIDVLVNNAGYGLFGGIEEVTMQEARDQMETNFFGALAVTQAVLPIMRAQKSGHIFQISSIAGLTGTAGLGIYNASKHALEGFSEALYQELKPLNIKITLVEPGPFRTLWAGASMKYSEKSIDGYEAIDRTKAAMKARNGVQPGDPVKAALAIIQIAETEHPPLRLALGKIAIGAIQGKIDLLTRELNEWKELSAGADFE